jgi:tetratricopeptide (TPR) repeat protein
MIKQGRNDPCACGSGKKFKQCCGLTDANNSAAISPQAITQALRAAWANFEALRLEQSSAICQQILKVVPAQIDTLYLLGLIALKDGQITRAIEYLSIAVKRDPEKPQFVASLGFAYHEQGQLDLAVKAYRKAIALEPRYVDAHYNLHAALIKTSNLEDSISSLKNVVKLSPSDVDAIFMLGMLLDYQASTSEAEIYFKQLEHASPIIQSRLDAWNYLKTHANPLPAITGSIIKSFEIALTAAKVFGMVLEFGVRHGNSIGQLSALANQRVHGFDSFEGIPEDWHDEGRGSYSTKGVIPKVPNEVTLHQGWFDQTLPEFLMQHVDPVRLINIDCDIYSSTKTVLDLLAPRIVVGTVIVFDEYIGNEHWREDEYKAFHEAVAKFKWQYEFLCFSFFTKQVVVKITKV